MNALFLKILNMSISASWLILAVLVLRLVPRRAPKWINILMWGLAGLRLALPISIESAFSLVPSAQTVPADIEMARTPLIDSGIDAVNAAVNPVISGSLSPAVGASVNPLQVVVTVCAHIWLAGVAVMLIYTAVSYLRLRHRLSTAIPLGGNVYQSENAATPFVLGVFKPKIYLPFGLSEQDMEQVLAHERAHISRRDHWWKPLGFLLLALHWFNPLVWLGYVFFCRDIELACDERVIRALNGEQRADYTQALLTCSVRPRAMAPCPLAFGEVGIKERVKSVMNYKKPGFWVLLAALIVCAGMALCFLTNPERDNYTLRITIPAGSEEEIVYSDTQICPTKGHIIVSAGEGLGDTLVQLRPVYAQTETAYDESQYLTPGMPVRMEAEKGAWVEIGVSVQNPADEDIDVYLNVENVQVRIPSTVEYIGDAPAVSGIAQSLPYPEGWAYSSIKLQTESEPYELMVYLSGSGERDFEDCAAMAFDRIGNMGKISFHGADGELAAFTSEGYGHSMEFFITIGAEGVSRIEYSLPGRSGGLMNADETPFKAGERVLLFGADFGLTDLRGLEISARDEAGHVIWSAAVPESEENTDTSYLRQDDWVITNIK